MSYNERDEDKSVGFMPMSKDESERFIFRSIELKPYLKEKTITQVKITKQSILLLNNKNLYRKKYELDEEFVLVKRESAATDISYQKMYSDL